MKTMADVDLADAREAKQVGAKARKRDGARLAGGA
jgi:hypothetical protein